MRCVVQRGRGKADAVRTVLEDFHAECYLLMDADFTYPAAHVKELVDMLKNCDEVVGARRQIEPGAQGFPSWE